MAIKEEPTFLETITTTKRDMDGYIHKAPSLQHGFWNNFYFKTMNIYKNGMEPKIIISKIREKTTG